jgi:pimeloyl-ACP methyl ester carboxylesterase
MQTDVTLSDTTTIRYWTYHPEATITMVLIHGFTGSHEGFQYIIPLLPNIRFIVPDLPGFGASTIGRDDWSIDGIARLTNEFVASLRLPEPPHILGHSMGGLVVSSMLDQAPELYDKKAVLLSPVPTAIRTNDSRRAGAILGALQYAVGHRIPKVGERIVKSRTITRAITKLIMTTTDKELQKEIHSHHFKNLDYISSIEFYSKLHRDINRQGSIDHAKALRMFTILLISGDNDSVTPLREMRQFAAAIQPAQFIMLPGVGHLAHYEKALDVAEAIEAFISLR